MKAASTAALWLVIVWLGRKTESDKQLEHVGEQIGHLSLEQRRVTKQVNEKQQGKEQIREVANAAVFVISLSFLCWAKRE